MRCVSTTHTTYELIEKELKSLGRTKMGNANAERNKNKKQKQKVSSELVEFTPKDERNQKRIVD